jgi:hypothetical protein
LLGHHRLEQVRRRSRMGEKVDTTASRCRTIARFAVGCDRVRHADGVCEE